MSRTGDALRRTARELPARVATLAAPAVLVAALESAPVRTGRLRDSIRARAEGDRVVLEAGVDYAEHVDWKPGASAVDAAIGAAVRAA